LSRLRTGSTSGTIVATSSTISVADTSITPAPILVTVPDVVGLTSSAAQSAIISAGLTVSTSTGSNTSNPANNDKVESQSPVAGTSVSSGTNVNIAIWNYASASSITVSVTSVTSTSITVGGNYVLTSETVGNEAGVIVVNASGTANFGYFGTINRGTSGFLQQQQHLDTG